MPFSRLNKAILVAAATGTGCIVGHSSLVSYRKLNKKTGYYSVILKRDVITAKREPVALKDVIISKILKEDELDASGVKNQRNAITAVSETEAVNDGSQIPLPKPVEGEFTFKSLEDLLEAADELLGSDFDEERIRGYHMMQQAYPNFENEWTFLWRYARAAHLYSQTLLNKDENERKRYCEEAKSLAYKALELNPNDAEVHKWCALTLGTLSDFVPVKQKIQDGYQFKVHIDKALQLKPDDAILHHLCGRWCFGVADLTWVERKLATTIFGSPPTSSIDEALQQFLEAGKLKADWIENSLHIAKCYIELKDMPSAVHWLTIADNIESVVSTDDITSKKEVQQLLQQYK